MVDFDFYRQTFRGSALEASDFAEYAARAQDQLDKFRRVYTVRGDQRAQAMAVCAMAEAIAFFTAAQNGSGGAVYYASVGSVSMSGKGVYSQVDLSPRGQERELYRCACTYLDIYRGAKGC